MEHADTLGLTIRRLVRTIRWRRALFYGLRGLAWGFGFAVIPILFRSVLGPAAVPFAACLVGACLLVGGVHGLLLRVPAAEAAKLADRAFGLHDRLATGLELAAAGAAGPLHVEAIRDAAAHAERVDVGRAVPWRWPADVRLLPLPIVVLLVLPFLPPLPLLDDLVSPLMSGSEEAAKTTRAEPPRVIERPATKRPETAQRVEFHEREYAQREAPPSEHARGDLAAMFKDTNVAQKRPDFSSFLKQGDERLRLLERVDSLPDLQRDFTQSQYKVMFRKTRSLLGGMDPSQLSRERLRQLLDEMNRMGRRGAGGGEGDWTPDVWEGTEALAGGDMSRALEAMERALDKLRAMEERQRGGRTLDGGRDRGGRGREAGPGGGEGDLDEFGEAQGSLPGKGTNPGWRGDPTTRLGQDPMDLGVEGQMRRGRREAYDTNMVARGAQNPSRLPYMSVFSEYRKMMEDALAKESIPFDYRTQVKEYFQSLEAQ